MRAPAVSFAHKLTAATLAALLMFTLVPFAHADGEGIGAEGPEGAFGSEAPTSPQPPSDPSTEASGSSVTLSGAAEAAEVEGSDTKPLTLASGLVGAPSNFINSDVALDGEPIIGSFTVDGHTFAVTDESHVELVGVAPAVILSEGSEAAGPSVTLSGAAEGGVVEGSNSNQASEAGLANLALPETISYEDTTYTLASIAPYAFYLSGVTDVALPASVTNVDDRAFRSSDVANVDVAEGNPTYSSFDGALYDADQLSLLLIPEGKQGTVRIPKTAEVVEASVFSHCPLADSISVDAGSAAFASENGLLYDASLTTLLRVPAGATDIVIRDGCTTIAAGAMEACVSLATITAPASVTSVSPDVFTSVPTVSLPAVAAVADDPGASTGATEESSEQSGSTPVSSPAGTQITAMVALSSTDDDLPEVDCSRITVQLAFEGSANEWERLGFVVTADEAGQPLDEDDGFDVPVIEEPLQGAEAYGANTFTIRNCMEQESSDLFYYISVSKISTSANTITLGGPSGSNKFNNMTFGGTTDSQWQMYNTPYGMAVVRSDGKGALLSKTPFNSSYPTSFTSVSTYLSYYTPWECAYYVKTDGTVVKQPANYQSFYWNQVSAVYVTPGPSILETYHYNDGTGATAERWMAPTYHWTHTISISRTGYTSQGWWTSATGGDKFADMGGSTTTIYKNVTARTTRSYYAHWTANSYTIEYWNKAGTTKLSSDTGFKYDTARNLAAKPTSGINAGYTAEGWSSSTNQSTATYGFGSSQKNLATSGTKKLYLAETANTITLTWNSHGGSTVANTTQTYSASAKVRLPSAPTKAGNTFKGWFTAESGGTQVTASTALPTSNTTYHAQWKAEPWVITLDDQGAATSGSGAVYVRQDHADNSYYSDRALTTTIAKVKVPTKAGYRFDGYYYMGGSRPNQYVGADGALLAGTGRYNADTVLYARWDPIISAVVPLDVTARVDLLGIEEQTPATGYIESRCGEPLKVARVDLTPLDGAKELFGAGNVADVFLEVLANDGASPNARFSLGASATESDASKLQALTMASYGTRIPISYRFAMPPEVQTSLVEYADPQPVCSVAYTVALV